MTAQRATILAASAAALAFAASPASAQVDEGIVLNIMRECAKIDDPTARLACYDNNIRSAGANPRTSVPGRMVAPTGGAAPAVANTPQGFGYEDVRPAARYASTAGQLDEISAKITGIRQREPGIYAFSLEGGAQWIFAEGVNNAYRLPQAGSTVEIARGALGSFLMRFGDQKPVPVRRVR